MEDERVDGTTVQPPLQGGVLHDSLLGLKLGVMF